MLKNTKLPLIIIGLLLLAPIYVSAADIKSGNNVYLPPQETIDGNLYAASNNITIDGEIKGDLIAAAQTITVNGRLDGDLIAAAQTITVNGEINGSVRLAGNSAQINGTVARNLNFIGNALNVEKNAKIGWDLMSGANSINIAGLISGNVYGKGDNIILSGNVGKNLEFIGGKNAGLSLSPESSIGGNLSYSENIKTLKKDGAQISGQIKLIKNKERETNKNYFFSLIYKILAAIIVGLIIIFPGRKIVEALYGATRKNPGASLGWGLLALLAIPALSLILIFTVIGIPLALLSILGWLLALYLGKVTSAIFIGKEVQKLLKKYKEKSLLAPLLIGVTISWLLFSIPFIGWLISLGASCLGLGSLIVYLKIRK
ncbi:MAG: polymer-forming cytoskeletal protein [Patescibacteria group bacterium]|nr:polymer-forming cytoskeletal protein [Patescibacteria group bacterium]